MLSKADMRLSYSILKVVPVHKSLSLLRALLYLQHLQRKQELYTKKDLENVRMCLVSLFVCLCVCVCVCVCVCFGLLFLVCSVVWMCSIMLCFSMVNLIYLFLSHRTHTHTHHNLNLNNTGQEYPVFEVSLYNATRIRDKDGIRHIVSH